MTEIHSHPSPSGRGALSLTNRQAPTHPRRGRVPSGQRKRIDNACDVCNKKHIKCSGGQPCKRCKVTGQNCKYSPSDTNHNFVKEERKRLRADMERLQAYNSALEKGIHTIVPHDAPRVLRQLTRGEPPDWAALVHGVSATPESTESDDGEGRMLFDEERNGRYLGGSSGATFLDQIKRFIRTLSPVSDAKHGSTFESSINYYQTYDSRPLPNPDVDPGWLPRPAEMESMLQSLSRYIQDGNGTFGSGGTLWWGDLVNVPRSGPLAHLGMMDGNPNLAFYHACFALSVLIGHTSLQLPDSQTAEAHFTRARILIGDPSIRVHTLTDVPTLTLMAIYLIEVNRRDLASQYVALAANTAIMYGAFRSVAYEGEKRVFWSLYILDRWISMLMGRPPVISDESFRLLPPASAPGMPPCIGLCANVELAKISEYVVREVYRIAPRERRNLAYEVKADEALRKLDDWYGRLPVQLQVNHHEAPHDLPCYTMHMSYNQLIILTTRPIFFAAIKRSASQQVRRMFNESSFPGQPSHKEYTRLCTEAAKRNVQLARLMQDNHRRWLQPSLHFLFNAAVVLLLDRMSSAYDDRIDTDKAIESLHSSNIAFAIDIFTQEAKTGTNYQADCCKVLQDLQVVSDRCLDTQRKPNPQQYSGAQNYHSSSPWPAPLCEQRSSNGIGADAAVLEELEQWLQNDNLIATLSI